MSSRDALVGFTGLVGGTLHRDGDFGCIVNSSNADDLRGGSFREVVFAAARAEKWRANADPDTDRRHIADLVDLLGSFRAEHLTLISTVDVYREPQGVDEETRIDIDRLHQYGAGRRALELAAQDLHPGATVVRLPALFGVGLKKNVVFDLLHANNVEAIQPESRFQYYDLARLTDDLAVSRSAGLTTVNLVTEPVSTADVVRESFRMPALPERPELPVARYDVRTRWAGLFDRDGGYIAGRDEVLQGLSRFVSVSTARPL